MQEDDKALPYLELAAKLHPLEAKWPLMVATCLQRIGATSEALDVYRNLQVQQPLNVECLTHLVHLSQQSGGCTAPSSLMYA